MKMILSDGSVLDTLELNGNNYVSKEEITEDMFSNNLETVTIESEEGTEELHDCVLENLQQFGEDWFFIIREMTAVEAAAVDREAQILYTALCTDTLLEG